MNTVLATRDELINGRGSARATCRAALDRLEAVEPSIDAFLSVLGREAESAAAAVDSSSVKGPLAGVPVALKDNLCLNYGTTTAGSRILEGYHSPFTATCVRKLIDAGAVIIGKTNLDEFAMGSSTENSAFKPTRNPWDLSRVPGGSSGGSAAAVAAGIVPLALGSDTGGSIRQPASFCGIVGVKPTYGRISRYGLIAYASSLDQVGTLTHTVRDAAIALDVLCGQDPLDATSSSRPAPKLAPAIDQPIEGLTLAVPKQARSSANHAGVAAAFESAIAMYRSLGATIVDVDLPVLDHAVAAYYLVATAEASSNLARFDGIRYGRRATLSPGEGLGELYCKSRSEGFGAEVQRRIMLGTYALSSGYYDAYYNTALRVRRKLKMEFDALFARGIHAVITPTAPNPAFKLGEKTGDPLAMYLEDVYTVPVNLAGLPAASIPCGFADDRGSRLPVGLQLIAQAFEETALLRAARMFEIARGTFERTR